MGFRLITSPFLEVERKKPQVLPSEQSIDVPPEFRQEAADWFPDDPWVAQSGKHFRDSGRYVYFQDFDLINDSHSVIFKPIAMLWRPDEGEVPVTVAAESAQIDHSRRFSLQDAQLGRITGGYVAGNVQIRGPDGLSITARTFHLSEDSMMLWSSEPVQFAWQGHTGSAESGIEIHFNGDPAEGLMKVTDIRRINLLGRVICNIDMPGRRLGDEDLKVRVLARQGFEFDLLTRTATFQGSSATADRRSGTGRQLKPSEEVWVQRRNPDDTLDQLVCPELKLQFRNRLDPESATQKSNSLQIEHVTAWGERVVFHSQKQNVLVIANDLQYAVDLRRLDIRNTQMNSQGQPSLVEVRQLSNQLAVPHIRVYHASDGTLERLECNGAGTIVGKPTESSDEISDESRSSVFGASWKDFLRMQLSSDLQSRLILLKGDAEVRQMDQSFGLTGQSIAMRVRLPVQTDSKQQDTDDSSVAEESIIPADLTALKPELLTATGNVVLTSPDGTGRLREKLTVRFEEMPPAPATTDATQSDKGLLRTVSNSRSATKDADSSSEMSFVSDTLDAIIRISSDPENRQIQFHNLWLNGNVEIVRQSGSPEDSFTAVGNQLYAATGLQNERDIQLFGDPARLKRASGTLEGPRIDLKEIDGKAEVVGSGRIRFLTNRSVNGQELPRPVPLDIYWTDNMYVQDKAAHFLGSIRVVMQDQESQEVEVRCSGLTVHFDRAIDMGSIGPDGEFRRQETETENGDSTAGPIERIEFHNRVLVSVDQTQDGRVTARHNAEFADLTVDLRSGDFNATGPGFLESVTPDRNHQLQGSAPPAARANSPAQTTETSYVHLNVSFIGELTGNLHQKNAALSHHVQAVVVPVRRLDEEVNINEVPTSELPERAGILSAEELFVTTVPSPNESPDSFAIVARRNARLESKTISGNADIITFDQSKEQFILRAEGDGFVTVLHRNSPNGRANRSVGKRFEYYRNTNQLNADHIRSLEVIE